MASRDVFRVLFLAFLFLLGSAVGSFLACQARRLRLRETGNSSAGKRNLKSQKSAKKSSLKTVKTREKFSKHRAHENRQSKNHELGKRSVCLNCHYQLKWYDNIPIISWLALKGRCRKCGAKIGALEIWAEILTGLAFLMCGGSVIFGGLDLASNGSGFNLGTCLENFEILSCSSSGGAALWFEIGILILVLVFVASLCFLAIYDGMYGELPVNILTFSIICATIIAILEQTGLFLDAPGAMQGRASNVFFGQSFLTYPPGSLLNLAGAVGILGGVYLVLYLVSRGKWVGDGDWLLGLALGLVLGDIWLALITLLLANLLALTFGLVTRKQKIYFGPFLVTAFVVVLTFSENFKSMIL